MRQVLACCHPAVLYRFAARVLSRAGRQSIREHLRSWATDDLLVLCDSHRSFLCLK